MTVHYYGARQRVQRNVWTFFSVCFRPPKAAESILRFIHIEIFTDNIKGSRMTNAHSFIDLI